MPAFDVKPVKPIVRSFDELTTRELYDIAKLRTDVFFVEQRVDETELDGRDLEPTCEHWWIPDEDGFVIAYLRVLLNPTPEYRDAYRIIGRVVTREDHRRQGLALQLVRASVAAHPGEAFILHAQEYARELYSQAGFVAVGERFIEATIPHVSMYLARR